MGGNRLQKITAGSLKLLKSHSLALLVLSKQGIQAVLVNLTVTLLTLHRRRHVHLINRWTFFFFEFYWAGEAQWIVFPQELNMHFPLDGIPDADSVHKAPLQGISSAIGWVASAVNSVLLQTCIIRVGHYPWKALVFFVLNGHFARRARHFSFFLNTYVSPLFGSNTCYWTKTAANWACEPGPRRKIIFQLLGRKKVIRQFAIQLDSTELIKASKRSFRPLTLGFCENDDKKSKSQIAVSQFCLSCNQRRSVAYRRETRRQGI